MNNKELIVLAKKALINAYSPYSDFKVGAALLTEDGKVFTGCNIENVSYSATICAERTAFSKAISEGYSKFKAIAIIGGKNGEITSYTPPCGICRQVMSQFCNKDFKIILAKSEEDYKIFTLSELLPNSFSDLK